MEHGSEALAEFIADGIEQGLATGLVQPGEIVVADVDGSVDRREVTEAPAATRCDGGAGQEPAHVAGVSPAMSGCHQDVNPLRGTLTGDIFSTATLAGGSNPAP